MTEKGTLSTLKNIFTVEKRFKSEYEILDEIGKGGFASVYHVRNTLDHNEYAIKKIMLSVSNKSLVEITKEIERVLKEIRSLAKIKSENIVNYNHSWIEVELRNVNENIKSECNKIDIESDDSKYEDYSFSQNDNLIQFERVDNDFKAESLLPHVKNPTKSIIHDTITFGETKYELSQINRFVIYIQMELCKETLGDKLQKRQMELGKKNCDLLDKDGLLKKEIIKEYITIFQQICDALSKIHSLNLIHRDLKPFNIFISNEDKIKIGDFGLVASIEKPDCIEENKQSRKKLSFDLSSKSNQDVEIQANCLTKNVGTLTYASPEQLNENNYDEKADIYSIGLILFELVYPLKTVMERNQKFADIKKLNKLPKNLIDNYPKLSKIILDTVNINSKFRPSAKKLVKIFDDSIIETKTDFTKGELKRIKDKVSFNSTRNLISLPLQDESIESNKRQRFKSEDLFSYKGYEMRMKILSSENQESTSLDWENIYVKLINKKILILKDSKSSKASSIYNLSECEITTKCENDLSPTFLNDIKYDIEIDHPFLEKCVLRSDHLLDALELFSNIKNQTKYKN